MTSLLCTILAPLAFVAAVLFGVALFHVVSEPRQQSQTRTCLQHRSFSVAAERGWQLERPPILPQAARDVAHLN